MSFNNMSYVHNLILDKLRKIIHIINGIFKWYKYVLLFISFKLMNL
jgi:hypothetical protein